jgi:hypothetical protein
VAQCGVECRVAPRSLWRNAVDIQRRIPVEYVESFKKSCLLLFQGAIIPKCHLKSYQSLPFRNSVHIAGCPPRQKSSSPVLGCLQYCGILAFFVWSWGPVRHKGAAVVCTVFAEWSRGSFRTSKSRGFLIRVKKDWNNSRVGQECRLWGLGFRSHGLEAW